MCPFLKASGAMLCPPRRCSLAWKALLLAAIMLPFPWVRISCVETRRDGTVQVSDTVTQTGLQAMVGDGTVGGDWLSGLAGLAAPSASATSARPKAAERALQPLMVGHVAALAVGLVGVWVVPRTRRGMILRIASGVALAALAVQFAIGLPLEQKLRADPSSRSAHRTPADQTGVAITTTYTPWFWIALGATATATGLSWFGGCVPRREAAVKGEPPIEEV